jgi:riboflavin biosynthesis pyrimidine reductase
VAVTDEDAATHFTLLGPVREIDVAELVKLYGYPGELSRCSVRANMIASLDGAASVDGRAGGLAGRGDRALFKIMREVADVVLVGAGTVRAENYSGAQLSVAARQRRQARDQREVPPIAVISASGALEPDSRLFMRTETAPLIFTTTASFGAACERLHGRAEVIEASTTDPIVVDLRAVMAELAQRGLYRVLCEGGPTLLGQIIAADLLDQLALTIAPVLIAGTAMRIAVCGSSVATRLRASHSLTDEDGYLYQLLSRGA